MSAYDFLYVLLTRPLAVLVTLIGGGALVAGTFSLVMPETALQVYGIATSPTPRESRIKSLTRQDYEPIARSLSIRNITLGLSILTITAYWQRIVDDDPSVGHAIQTCLGYIIMVGSLAPAVDAYGAWKDGSDLLRWPTTILHCFRLAAWIAGGVWCLNS